jgi:hypothetical protein
MEQEPPMIGDHLVVRQEKSTNAGLVRPLVVKNFFIIHLLDFTLQNQTIPNADVPILRPVNGRPILEDSIIPGTQKVILAYLLEPTHVFLLQQMPANLRPAANPAGLTHISYEPHECS